MRYKKKEIKKVIVANIVIGKKICSQVFLLNTEK